MKKTVVILLSDKRSGSTLFQRELTRHQDVQGLSYSPHTYLESHHWLKAAVILQLPAEKFSSGKVYPGYGSRKNARAYMIDGIHGNVHGFQTPMDDKSLVYEGWEALCTAFAKPVFFEKSPQHLANRGALELMLDWISKTDFDVKIIGLTRNPMAVMYSAKELFHTPPEKRQQGWMEIQENLNWIKGKIKPEQFLHVKYEDMISKARDTFNMVFDFIGVEDDPAIGSTAHPRSLNRWVQDPYFNFRLSDSARAMAADYGYTDEDVFNPEKADPPLSFKVKTKFNGIIRLSIARARDWWIRPLKMRLKKWMK